MEVQDNKRWFCSHCNSYFKSRNLLKSHLKENNIVNPNKRGRCYEPYVECYCDFCGRKFTRKSAKTLHEKSCRQNPNWKKREACSKVYTDEYKKKVSEGMKKAYREGRAGSWPSRKGLCHSYPELWLIKLLYNDFSLKENIDYETEYSFFGQFLDFAWVDKKICIEIDGEQHNRFEDRIKNDQKKDKKLKEENWKLLRLNWTDVYNETQKYIDIIKNFLIDNGAVV